MLQVRTKPAGGSFRAFRAIYLAYVLAVFVPAAALSSIHPLT